VALIAFRGSRAEVLLPPTQALARAKRSLAGLPGGGPTPLASGIDAAVELAVSERRAGRSALIVLMTDGRANIARDGAPGHARANLDALDAARAMRAAGVSCILLDTAPRPQPAARALAEAGAAIYLPMPMADSARMARAAGAAAQRLAP
jgi:magnesium chelatase subunit D